MSHSSPVPCLILMFMSLWLHFVHTNVTACVYNILLGSEPQWVFHKSFIIKLGNDETAHTFSYTSKIIHYIEVLLVLIRIISCKWHSPNLSITPKLVQLLQYTPSLGSYSHRLGLTARSRGAFSFGSLCILGSTMPGAQRGLPSSILFSSLNVLWMWEI